MVRTMKFVSVLLVAVVLSVRTGSADEPPTPDSIIGKAITPELAKNLPHRDCSTPQNAFLGFLRSSVEFDLRDFLFYLTPQAKKLFYNVNNEDEISYEMARTFKEGLDKDGFKEFRLMSFQSIPPSIPTQIIAVVNSPRGKMTGGERLNIGLVQTNGLWKFTYVNISVVEGNESYE